MILELNGNALCNSVTLSCVIFVQDSTGGEPLDVASGFQITHKSPDFYHLKHINGLLVSEPTLDFYIIVSRAVRTFGANVTETRILHEASTSQQRSH